MSSASAESEFAARTPRVIFDPNSVSRSDPRNHIALLENADCEVFRGEVVQLWIPAEEDDEPDTIGAARVLEVADGLIYLRVIRDSFRDVERTSNQVTLTASAGANTTQSFMPRMLQVA